MSALRAALFEWDSDRVVAVLAAGTAVYVAINVADGTLRQSLLVVVLPPLFAGAGMAAVELARRGADRLGD